LSWIADEGCPYPLGVSWCGDEQVYNFALYAKHATRVRLLVFGDDLEVPRLERVLDPYANKSGRVWHCRIAAGELAGCRHYGYCIDGPEPAGPFEVHAFHPEKLLLDPYARTIVFPPRFSRAAAIGDAPNIGQAPLGVIEVTEPPRSSPRPPMHEADAIIYELHVRGFTQHASSGVSERARGRFAGIVEKIPYLRELGVTIVELMPVFQGDPQGADVWGYMPLSFFAPDHRYGSADDFRTMVAALHAAGIEVVIDAVYNHTAEAGRGGPVYHFKGIDNSTYYLMRDGEYSDFAGCGNSVNANNRYVRKMILDSMRYWVREMHVDGFRFDLASVFARAPDGSLSFEDPPIFGDITSDPAFDRVRLIAEPWDAGGAYELGRAFPGTTWLQWNARFRDDVRRFVRGEPAMTGALMQRLYGSDDLFPDDVIDAYHAYQSVNFVTSHDGLTLWDLALHERAAKNLIALTLLANGTPMLRAGDEFLQTQGGQDNPYDQDNETTWLDWRRRDEHAGFWRFVQQMIAFRTRHPSLARSRFWRSDVGWYGPRGVVDLATPLLAIHLRGASQHDDDLYVLINETNEPVPFVVQTGSGWRLAIDTSQPTPDDIVLAPARELARPSYAVEAHSVVVLVSPQPVQSYIGPNATGARMRL